MKGGEEEVGRTGKGEICKIMIPEKSLFKVITSKHVICSREQLSIVKR